MKMIKKLALLLCAVMVLCSFAVTVFAAEEANIVIEADTAALADGTVEFTVYLDNADKMDGGVWNVEFKIALPEGLTYVADSAELYEGEFDMPFFNENLKWSSMGRTGEGYTGEKLALVTFTCKVDAEAAGDLVVTVVEGSLCLTDKDGKSVYPTAPECELHICGDLEKVAEVPSTCEEHGVAAHEKCACGKLYKDGKEVTEADLVLPLADHTFGEWEEVKAPTCTEKGEEKRVCSVCGETETREVAMIEHDHSEEWFFDNETHWHECECGHKADEGKHESVIVEDEDGNKHEVCEICGADLGPADTGDNTVVFFVLAAVTMMGLVALTAKKKEF